MRDIGAQPGPLNSFILNLGLESLHLRVKRHSESAQTIAEWLEKHPRVAWVNYPGLKSSKYYDLAQKYLPNGCSGVLTFGLKDGRDGAHAAMAKFPRIYIATHVADAQSSVLNPANTTHRQLTDAELLEAGVTPDMIRLSVGLEDTEDLIQDLETALAQ